MAGGYEDMPAQWIGREVSARATATVWEGVRARGLDPEFLAADTGYTAEELTDPKGRVSWSGFVQMMTNLGTKLDDAALIELGSELMNSPFLRAALLPARMLFGIEEIYRWTFGPKGPPSQLIPVNHVTFSQLAPGHMRLDVRLKDGYAPSRENFLLARGSLVGLARMGRTSARVSHTLHERGATFDIYVERRATVRDRIRRMIGRPERLHQELFERYAELEREVATRIAAEQRYRQLFEHGPLPMWVFDRATLQFLAVNRAATRAYGYTAEEFAAMTIDQIRPSGDIPALREDLARHTDERRLWRHHKKDGSVMHVEISARDIDFEGRPARLVHVFDMTERLALEEQVREAQKLEAIGRLAGGVAHDFNNLLQVISSYTELILRDARDASLHADLRAIRSAADRGAELTQKLLMFARRKLLEPSELELGDVVRDMAVLLRPLLMSGQDLALDIANAGKVVVDRGGVERVLTNLVVNARDAIPGRGTITIGVRSVDIDADYARKNIGIVPGRHAALVVSDTGMGMDTTTRTRIFEPFFTTKELGKGTGLGLSTVLGIVQQNGGHVHVDSKLGSGTTVSVYFPQARA